MYNLSINNISDYGLNFLSDHLLETVQSPLAKRVAIVALIVLGGLSAIFLVFCCCCYCDDTPVYYGGGGTGGSFVSNIFSNTNIPEDKIDDLEQAEVKFNSVVEEQKLIKSLKQNWIEDPQEEEQRLTDAKILLPFSQAIITHLPQNNYLLNHSLPPNAHHLPMIVGRVLELKQIYRPTHYVFTHAQSLSISVVNQIIKEFVRHVSPFLHHPLKIPFRVPHTTTYTENADDFITKHQAIDDNSSFADNYHSDEMISVDAQCWNTDSGESALYYLAVGTNINQGQLANIFKTIFFNYVPDETISLLLAEKASKIATQKQTEARVGNLYAICIPKSVIQNEKTNFAYRCHPYGKRCDCYPASDRIKVLEQMQRNKVVRCTSGLMAQYRLLTSRLTEEKDVRTFAVNALPKSKRKFYRDQIKELVKEAMQYSHLFDLIENLEEDPSMMDQINSLIEASPQLDPKYIQHLFAAKGIFYHV
jgi:hypothetical protein